MNYRIVLPHEMNQAVDNNGRVRVKDGYFICPKCNGNGKYRNHITCLKCKGTGLLRTK